VARFWFSNLEVYGTILDQVFSTVAYKLQIERDLSKLWSDFAWSWAL